MKIHIFISKFIAAFNIIILLF